MKYIDAHTHLTDSRIDTDNLYNDLQDFIVVNSGYDLQSTIRAKELAEKYKNSYFTCGLHPNELKGDYKDFLNRFDEFLGHPKCLALGECGLDYHYSPDLKDEQKRVFLEQIEICHKWQKPLVIHSREATADMTEILFANKEKLTNGILLHCYSDSAEIAKEYLKLGAYFSFGGVITFKNAKKERVLGQIPIERVLSETDSPYMSPEPFRGRLNTSLNIPIIVEKLAQIYNVTHEQMKEQLFINAQNFYKAKF